MPLHLSLSRDDLAVYVAHQISTFFPDQEVLADDLLAPLNSIVHGLPPETGVKPADRDVVAHYFHNEEKTH